MSGFSLDDLWGRLFDFSDYDRLVPLVVNSLWAGALLALIGGLIGVFVMTRDLSFAVHGVSELAFAGAAIALLVGMDVVLGSVVGSVTAAGILAFLGSRARDRNSIVAVLMPAGLGIGLLALALYPGRAANKFGLLTGQIVAVDDPKLEALAVITAIVLVSLLAIWRPLAFASLDAEVAAGRGVPVRALGIGFMFLLGLAAAAAVQVVGALLVLALLVTPAAAALRLSSSQLMVPLISVGIALTSVLGGIMLALGSGLPISPYITTISFLFYLLARLIQYAKTRSARAGAAQPAQKPVPASPVDARYVRGDRHVDGN
jgi:zinc/manganese transport system permease protein